MSVRVILENSDNTLAVIEGERGSGDNKDLVILYDNLKYVQNALNSTLTDLIGAANSQEEEEDFDTEEDEEKVKTGNGARSPKKLKTC